MRKRSSSREAATVIYIIRRNSPGRWPGYPYPVIFPGIHSIIFPGEGLAGAGQWESEALKDRAILFARKG